MAKSLMSAPETKPRIRLAMLLATRNEASGEPYFAWQRVGGLPVVLRQCILLARHGIERIGIMVSATDLEEIRDEMRRVTDDRRLAGIELQIFDESGTGARNLREFVGTESQTHQEGLLVRAAAVFQADLLANLLGNRGKPPADGMTCVEKVTGSGGSLRLPTLCRCAPGVLPNLVGNVDREKGGDVTKSFQALVADKLERGRIHQLEAETGWLIRLESSADLRHAEDRLFQDCRKSIDGPGDRYVNRYISLALSRRLKDTPLTANMVSIVTLAIGVAAGFAATDVTYLGCLTAALLLQLNSILDCVDGELARVRLEQSWLGQWLDTLSDDLSNMLFLGGLAWGVGAQTSNGWLAISGAVACASQLLMCLICYPELIATGSGDLLSLEWEFDAHPTESKWTRFLSFARWIVKRDFFILAFLAVSLAGVLPWALPIAAVGGVSAVIAGVARLWSKWGPRGAGPRPLQRGATVADLVNAHVTD